MFWRVATASESNPTVSMSATSYCCGLIARYSGVDTANPIRAFSLTRTPTPGSTVTASTALAAPAGVQASDMVAQFYGFGSWNSAASSSVFPRYPSTGGWNQRSTAKDGNTVSHSYVAAMTYVDLLGATGTYPTTNCTTTATGSTAVAGTWATIAVAPARLCPADIPVHALLRTVRRPAARSYFSRSCPKGITDGPV